VQEAIKANDSQVNVKSDNKGLIPDMNKTLDNLLQTPSIAAIIVANPEMRAFATEMMRNIQVRMPEQRKKVEQKYANINLTDKQKESIAHVNLATAKLGEFLDTMSENPSKEESAEVDRHLKFINILNDKHAKENGLPTFEEMRNDPEIKRLSQAFERDYIAARGGKPLNKLEKLLFDNLDSVGRAHLIRSLPKDKREEFTSRSIDLSKAYDNIALSRASSNLKTKDGQGLSDAESLKKSESPS